MWAYCKLLQMKPTFVVRPAFLEVLLYLMKLYDNIVYCAMRTAVSTFSLASYSDTFSDQHWNCSREGGMNLSACELHTVNTNNCFITVASMFLTQHYTVSSVVPWHSVKRNLIFSSFFSFDSQSICQWPAVSFSVIPFGGTVCLPSSLLFHCSQKFNIKMITKEKFSFYGSLTLYFRYISVKPNLIAYQTAAAWKFCGAIGLDPVHTYWHVTDRSVGFYSTLTNLQTTHSVKMIWM